MRNAFKPWVRVTLQEVPGGTMLNCQSQMHPFIVAFTVFWFSVTTAFGLLILIKRNELSQPLSPALLTPVGMLAAGSLLVKTARQMNRGDARLIIQMVAEATVARLSCPEDWTRF
jgi:hypothetical protein